MGKHNFTSNLRVSNWNKSGIPRLRVSLKTSDYNWICANGEVKYLRKMTLVRKTGQQIEKGYPRISKGTTTGKYTPHYITVSAPDVKKYGFQPNEPVKVYLEW